MMQGNLVKYEPTEGFDPFQHNEEQAPRDKRTDILEEPVLVRRGPGRPPFKGRKKGSVVNGFTVNTNLPLDMVFFGTTHEREIEELFEVTGHTWCHTCCARWSEGVEEENSRLKNVDKAVFKAMDKVFCQVFQDFFVGLKMRYV